MPHARTPKGGGDLSRPTKHAINEYARRRLELPRVIKELHKRGVDVSILASYLNPFYKDLFAQLVDSLADPNSAAPRFVLEITKALPSHNRRTAAQLAAQAMALDCASKMLKHREHRHHVPEAVTEAFVGWRQEFIGDSWGPGSEALKIFDADSPAADLQDFAALVEVLETVVPSLSRGFER